MHRASFAAAGMHGACGASLGHHWVIVRPSIVGPSLGHRWVVVGSSLGWCMVLRHPHGCMGPLGYVGPSWGHHWVIVGSSSGHPWVIIFGSLLGHRWVIIFGSLLGHHWVILGMVCGPETPPQLYGSDARPAESERRPTPAPPSERRPTPHRVPGATPDDLHATRPHQAPPISCIYYVAIFAQGLRRQSLEQAKA